MSLRFLKIKERQVNKINKLLLKKQGNITWLSTVFPTQAGNPWAGNPHQASSTISQGDIIIPPQAECTDVQAASTCPLAVSTNSQGVSVASPQAGSLQAIQAGSSQAESADAQAASTSPLAIRTNFQGVSTASPQAGNSQAIQTGRSQAIISGTNSQGNSTISPQAGSFQVEGADAQAASTSPQAVSNKHYSPRLPSQIDR